MLSPRLSRVSEAILDDRGGKHVEQSNFLKIVLPAGESISSLPRTSRRHTPNRVRSKTILS